MKKNRPSAFTATISTALMAETTLCRLADRAALVADEEARR